VSGSVLGNDQVSRSLLDRSALEQLVAGVGDWRWLVSNQGVLRYPHQKGRCRMVPVARQIRDVEGAAVPVGGADSMVGIGPDRLALERKAGGAADDSHRRRSARTPT